MIDISPRSEYARSIPVELHYRYINYASRYYQAKKINYLITTCIVICVAAHVNKIIDALAVVLYLPVTEFKYGRITDEYVRELVWPCVADFSL